MPEIDECLFEAMALPGARGAAVVEWTSGLALGTAGDPLNGGHETTAAETAELARMAVEHMAFAPAAPSGHAADGATWRPGAAEGAPAGAGNSGRAAGATGHDPGKDVSVEDVVITTHSRYHVLRFVETAFDSSVFVHVWLDRYEGNLALARIRLRDLAERLAPA